MKIVEEAERTIWIDDEKYFEIDESLDHLLLDLSETRKSSQKKKKKIIGFSF